MKFTEAKSLNEWEEKTKRKSFPSKEEINVLILFREKDWMKDFIMKCAIDCKRGDKFDSISESLERLTVGIIHKLMDAGWINYEFILTSLSIQSEWILRVGLWVNFAWVKSILEAWVWVAIAKVALSFSWVW